MEPSDDFFHQQELQLGYFTDVRTKRFLDLLNDARQSLFDEISAAENFTNARLQTLLGQIDDIIAQVKSDILSVGPSSQDLAKMSKAHLEASTIQISGLSITIPFDRLNTDTLRLFSQNELIHVTGLVESEKQAIKSILFSKVGVKGESPSSVARQIAGKQGRFAGKFGHIETILRTETATIYNAQSLEGIAHANETHGLTLKKRIVETIDAKRNHPISQVLNNQVREPGQKFKAKVSEVEKIARKLGKSRGGIFWPIVDGYYTGERLPAHYRDRGITVPTMREVTKF